MNFQTFCNSIGCADVHTDEDYKKMLLRRQRLYIGMMIFGILTFAVATIAEVFSWEIALSSRDLGFYCGMGTGVTFGAAVFLLRLRKALKNPDVLHAARIKATDERMLEISRRSIAAAGYALLIAVYLACLIGGLYYPVLLTALAILAGVFFIAYLLSFFIYSKKM